jgi:hypothetical protein
MNADGTFTETTTLNARRYEGIASRNRNLAAFTMDETDGGKSLGVVLKAGGTNFSTANLKGAWYAHGLVSGDTADWKGWFHIKWKFDNAGNSTCLEFRNSEGNSSCKNHSHSGWAVASNGTVTLAGQKSLNGLLNLDKNFGVATMNDGGGGYSLVLLTKTTTIPFSSADLKGRWYVQQLQSGWAFWTRLQINMDDAGNAVCQTYLDSDGSTTCFGVESGWTIDANGVITNPLKPGNDVHGIMSADKQTIVITKNEYTAGEYSLWVMVKMR